MRSLLPLCAAAVLSACSASSGGTGGGPVREAVLQARCEACHGALSAHGGAARELAACGGCHRADLVDAESGNALELGVLVHKIHRGRALPSVVAGTPYALVSGGETHDFSTVWYPQDLRRCASCHGGAQGDVWRTASIRACASCHDRTAFVDPPPPGWTLHRGGPQADDACGTCHGEAGDVPVAASHPDLIAAAAAQRVALAVQQVTNAGPGQTPVVRFRVTVNDVARNIQASPLTLLRATVAGPTADYARYWQATIQGSGAAGSLAPVDAADGVFDYTFPASEAVPADATGSYAVALEGYLQTGAVGAVTRHVAPSRPFFFAVTGPVPVPRRAVVDDAACDACHGELTAHSRRGVQYCVFCHNAENAGDERIARLEGTTVVAPSVHLKVLVHKIHRGADLVAQPYLVGANPTPSPNNPYGTQLPFGTVRYPRDLRDCAVCHLPGTADLPLARGALPSREEVLTCTDDPAADQDLYCIVRAVVPRYAGAEAAACTSCHDAPWTSAHAAAETTDDGAESCATCHASGAAFGVDVVHAGSPVR